WVFRQNKASLAGATTPNTTWGLTALLRQLTLPLPMSGVRHATEVRHWYARNCRSDDRGYAPGLARGSLRARQQRRRVSAMDQKISCLQRALPTRRANRVDARRRASFYRVVCAPPPS